MSTQRAILLSLFSWGLLALCIPPLPLGALALVALAPWFYVLKTASKKGALIASSFGAFLFNAISIYWLYHVGDVAPKALIFSGLFLAVTFLSSFTLLCAWVFIKLKQSFLLFLFPLFWAGIEVLRAKGDLSFPWLSLGLTFGNSLEFMQSYAVIGVFGCSAVIIASNMCVAEAFFKKKKILGLVPVALALCFYAGGSAFLFYEKDNKKVEETLKIAVVQPSIPQTKKWSKTYFDSVMTKTWNLLTTLNPKDVDLIIFPETAMPDFIKRLDEETKFLKEYAKDNNTAIVVGALNREGREKIVGRKKYDVYNSAFLFGSEEPVQEYRKMHLVPFSEKIPFDNIFPIVNYVDLGGGEFSQGMQHAIWQPKNFSPLICYEAIYGSIIRDAKRGGAKFIANITNDGWFKTSTAPYQHFNLVRAHAVENGIGVARAANTGISAFILPNGEVFEQTKLFEEKVITMDMPLKTRFTPYFVVGDIVEWILFIFSLVLIVYVKFFSFCLNPDSQDCHDLLE